MFKLKFVLTLIACSFAISVSAENVDSLRGHSLHKQQDAENLKDYPKDNDNVALSYIHQPPLIPHAIRGYQVDKNANKCLSCHSFKNAPKHNAPKISITHFSNRDDQVLSDVSPRRYFCQQCHVPQVNAEPLVDNDFSPAGVLSK